MEKQTQDAPMGPTATIEIDPGKLPAAVGGFSATAASVGPVGAFVDLLFRKWLPGQEGALATLVIRIPAARVGPIINSSGASGAPFVDQLEAFCRTRRIDVPTLDPAAYSDLSPDRTGLEYASFFQLSHAEDEAEFRFFKLSPYGVHTGAPDFAFLARVYTSSALMLAILRALRETLPADTENEEQ
ncbi:MAG: hypothetical protein GY719_14765 [bacterium]|nr:hypothetical protein [bacterium]